MQIFNTSIIELAVICALISLFLDFTFRKGNIFATWLDFLADSWLEKHKPIVLRFVEGKTDKDILLATDGKDESVREYKHERVDWFWFKPLGGCVVCMNVWISFIMCAFFFRSMELDLGVNSFVETICGALIFILLSNFIVRFFQEKIV